MHPVNVKQMQNLRNNGFSVHISHNRPLDGPESEPATTVCRIATQSGNATVGIGGAVCSPRDNFSKDVGSTLAFRRAVRNMTLPRHVRRELLEV